MTVGELTAEMSKMNPEMEVWVTAEEDDMNLPVTGSYVIAGRLVLTTEEV